MIKFTEGDELRKNLVQALDKVEQIVCSTMGAKGFNVGVPQRTSTPEGTVIQQITTKDGITVLQSLNYHDDKWVRLAVEKVFDAVNKQWSEVGDGTTLATLLCCSFYKRLVELYEADKTQNVHQLAKLATDTADIIVAELEKGRMTVENVEKLIDIATVSANNDPVLGKIIGQTVWDVGKYGHVSIEKTNFIGVSSEIYTGYGLNGILNPIFIELHTREVNYISDNRPVIFITTEILTKSQQFFKIAELYDAINKTEAVPRPFILLCTDFAGDCRDTLLKTNHAIIQKGNRPISIFPIRHEFEGNEKLETIRDLAALTGATVFGASFKKFENLHVNHLGNMDYFKCSTKESVLRYNQKSESVDAVVETINKELETEVSEERKTWLKLRLAKLTSGIAVIKVGGVTFAERGYRDDLVDDAVKTSQAAMKDGYVIGGGYALANLVEINTPKTFDSVLLSPIIKIFIENGGISKDNVRMSQLNNSYVSIFTGKQVKKEDFKVFDAYKSVAHAVKVAASFAATLITTKYLGQYE